MEPWQGAAVESLPELPPKVPVELPELPPKVPEELPELDRALQLLGAVCQAGRIKDKHRIELETLLGCVVTQQLAAHWKKHLKEIRRDLVEELKSNPEE